MYSSMKSTSTNTNEQPQQKQINSILSTTRTTHTSSYSTANSPSLICHQSSSPYSKPRLFKKVIISEAFPQNSSGNENNNDSDENSSKNIPINFENNLLKIKINQPSSDSKSTSPFCPNNNNNMSTLASTEFKTPNLTVKKSLKNNIEISTNSSLPANNSSNLVNEIKINLNKSNKKTGVVYSRYIYTGNNNNDIQSDTNTETNYDSLTEDNYNNTAKGQQKLRETSYELNDLIEDKNTTESGEKIVKSSSKIIGFHRF